MHTAQPGRQKITELTEYTIHMKQTEPQEKTQQKQKGKDRRAQQKEKRTNKQTQKKEKNSNNKKRTEY
jgi:hypothetical protein